MPGRYPGCPPAGLLLVVLLFLLCTSAAELTKATEVPYKDSGDFLLRAGLQLSLLIANGRGRSDTRMTRLLSRPATFRESVRAFLDRA